MEKKSLFEQLNPGQTFGVGLAGGFLVFCTIGFFILLAVVLGGGRDAGSTKKPSTVTQQPTAVQPSDTGAQAPGSADALAPITDADHIRGAVDANIVMVEYSDIECPFCQRFHDTMGEVLDKYGDQVQWVYRHFPLTSIHPNALPAAVASECAGAQGKFWEFVDAAFAAQSVTGVGTAALESIASQIGLNIAEYKSCVADATYQAKVVADSNNARALGAQGTPFTVVIGPDGTTRTISGAQSLAGIEAILSDFLVQ